MKKASVKISVKIVVFKPTEENVFYSRKFYYCYCPATNDFVSKGKTVDEVILYAKSWLLRLLENRLEYRTLKKYGWRVCEISAEPPIFVDDVIVASAERIHNMKIIDPIITTIDVELPEAKRTI